MLKPLQLVAIFGVLIFSSFQALAFPLDEASSLSKNELAKSLGEERPNIVFILTDDHRWDGYGLSGNEQIQTPHLDGLAKRGTRFTNAFVTLAICSPSRAACLTGQYGSSNGVTRLGKVPLKDPKTTFAHALKDAGYATGVAGKWHLGSSPKDCGFEFASTCEGNGTWYNRKFTIDDQTRKMPGFVDDVMATESIRFIQESKQQKKPFVLWMCTQVPHMDHKHTWPAKQEYLDNYKTAEMPLPTSWNDDLTTKPKYLKTARNRMRGIQYGYEDPASIQKHARDYYASVQQMDAAVGRVLDELAAQDLAENTWVILMGDNGWMLGEHGMSSKVLPYEESMRVPMAIVGPSTKPATSEELVLNIDLTATIFELAGLTVPQTLHGQSLLGLLGGKTPDGWRQSFLYEAPESELGSQPLWAVRTKKWKYIETHLADSKSPFAELYDMESDSIEMNNLASSPQHQTIKNDLAGQLAEARVQVEAGTDQQGKQGKNAQPSLNEQTEASITKKNAADSSLQDNRVQIGGVYPHLTMRNDEKECGTGGIVPWQGDLWAVTYGPHKPNGSSDKLYQITPDLNQIVFPESIGGTPANRMIHRETNQLLIGPYVVDSQKKIRTIPISEMYGRLTGNARHLTDPENKVYYATMEEGLYEVDLRSLAVQCLIRDGNKEAPKSGIKSELPGYHGKGLYSGQGRLLYSNNGEHGKAAKTDPTTTSGAMAQWLGEGDWNLVRRNQFTEITGPGGIYGSTQPETDPIWAMGWDEKSILLGLLEEKQWHYYRLPKASHSYDGAHGWNTEWPRIREIGEDDLLATMHGTFWRFPKSFSQANSAGILPRSNYLKVIGDFCRWNDKVVLGCDDSASAEFLNTRSFKAKHGAAKQSNSNLWFVAPAKLDQLGPAIGRGNVWLVEDLKSGDTSDPFLFNGYDFQQLHLNHTSATSVDFELEVDRNGNNQWEKLTTLTVAANKAVSKIFSPDERGAWIRLRTLNDAVAVTANFQYRNRDTRGTENDPMFAGVATTSNPAASFGLMRSQSFDRLGVVASAKADRSDAGYYELNQKLELVLNENPKAASELVAAVAQPAGSVSVDAASVIIEEAGGRYRLPKNADYQNIVAASNEPAGDKASKKTKRGDDQWARFGVARVCREVATERDLLNVHGTFYELPARNAQGLAKLRPIATHNLKVHDFCSHGGMLFFTGVDGQTKSERILRSADGKAAVWAGVVDDLWKLGKPRGVGGPWKDTKVNAGEASDPYLMTAFDKKSVQLSATEKATIRLEVDVDGTGKWMAYQSFEVEPGEVSNHEFPEGFSAYWVRAISEQPTTATVVFQYK